MRGSHDTLEAKRERSIELDFIRGLAILAVLGAHFHTVDTGVYLIKWVEYPLKSFGHEGVNLFFALSGFLVGGLLLRQYAVTGTIDARRFIIRRIFKIWPAYYVLILFHVVSGRHPRGSYLIQNLAHLQNYLGSSIAQTWSLAIEEHFYLLFPVLLLMLARKKLTSGMTIAVLASVCGVVLVWRSLIVYTGDTQAAFSHTQYRIDSLLYGAILAGIYWLKPELYARIARRKILLLVTVALLIAWLFLATPNVRLDESIGYSFQAIGFCALIILVKEHSGRLRAFRLYRFIAWLGVYSYGIYLWHSLALSPGDMVTRYLLNLGIPPVIVFPLGLGFQMMFAVGIGYVMTHAIEFPFLRIRDRLVPANKHTSTTTPAADLKSAA